VRKHVYVLQRSEDGVELYHRGDVSSRAPSRDSRQPS
jgi:hypothetical protein